MASGALIEWLLGPNMPRMSSDDDLGLLASFTRDINGDKIERAVNSSSMYMVYAAVCTLFMLTALMPAPYGRYSSGRWGVLLNARFAWFFQEFPSFFIPLMFLVFNVSSRRSLRADSEAGVALMLMVAHYANRSSLYPLQSGQRK